MDFASSSPRRPRPQLRESPGVSSGMLKIKSLFAALTVMLGAAVSLVLNAAPAQASHTQTALFEEDYGLLADPYGTMRNLHNLGVGRARVYMEWSAIAPSPRSSRKPAHFNSADPNAYGRAWGPYDAIVNAARLYNVDLDFLLTGGAPFWADGPGVPSSGRNVHFAWRPSTGEYRNFVHAVAARYPSVHNWEIWNEPNFGEDLGPQAVNGSRTSVGPSLYRGLLDAGFSALQSTGHGDDTIVFGQLSARGMAGPANRSHPQGLPGNFAQTKPLAFLRALYCVDGSFRQLRGRAAASVGCPTNAAGSRRFGADHPALFRSSGFGIHPYPQGLPPTQESSSDPDYVAFPEIPRLERTLDRLLRIYGSGRHYNIYNNEYGYVTRPPARGNFASPATASLYINWAEYLSWRDPRLVTSMQYLFFDPAVGGPSQFYSGLANSNGRLKDTFYAYRMPLFLPVTSTRRGHSLEVWGAVRPTHSFPHGAQAEIQFQRNSRGSFTTVRRLSITSPQGYFDLRVTFPASGSVRVRWVGANGAAIYSRVNRITVR